jgi:hypothetical protein
METFVQPKITGYRQLTPEEAALMPLDQRWISIGATDLQRGFMAVICGIAQPTTF